MPGSPDRPALTTVTVPDTELASAATQLVRDTTDDLIYHHSRRVYYFGGLQGRNGGLGFDPELLYVAAMFHDLGLNEEYRASGRRFEVDSADEARRFLRSHGVPEDGIRRVWTAIALHTTPGIPSFMEPEVALLDGRMWSTTYWASGTTTSATRTGRRSSPSTPAPTSSAASSGPSPRVSNPMATTFGNVKADVLERYVPGFERGNFVDTILDSAWPE